MRLNFCRSGSVQCRPERMATPSSLNTEAISWGWTLFMVKEIIEEWIWRFAGAWRFTSGYFLKVSMAFSSKSSSCLRMLSYPRLVR